MDTQQFFQRALEIARSNLPYTENPGDKERAAKSALEEAHVNLGQRDFFAAVDALGGHDALIQRLVAALPDAECPLCDPSNEGLSALLHRDALRRGDERHIAPIRTTADLFHRLGWEIPMLGLDPSEA